MKTPILGSSYVARSVNAADSRMVNLFPEMVPEGGKEAAFLSRCPGLRLLGSLTNGPIRGMWVMGDVIYIVAGNDLWEVSENALGGYVSSLVGGVNGNGPVSMSDNGTQLFIAANGPSYIYNTTTNAFATITDPDFPGALQVGYLDGYFVFNEPGTQKVWVTSLLDGTAIDPLDFASAEGGPDRIVGLIVDHREVWLFGTNSVEVWYNSGASDFPLQRVQGAFNEIGCAAAFSIAKMDNGLFWLGSDSRGNGMVYRASGYTGKRISTHAVEWQIQQYGDVSDAIGYTYQQDGHSFYVLTFPTANATWVYDVATEAWHERAGWSAGEFTRHRGNCQANFKNKVVIGDYENGNLYAFDMEVYSDNGDIQKWLRSWRALPTGQNNLKRTTHHRLQLDCATGVGLVATDPTPSLDFDFTTETYTIQDGSAGSDEGVGPQVMLRWSDDGGVTWSNEHWQSMGAIGAYSTRTIWRRLGMTLETRDRVYEVSGTDPVKIAIVGAELQISQTDA